jgi:hypothetical protein
MLFAIAKRISVSALSSKMNRRLVSQKAMRIKHMTFLLITRQLICAPNVRRVKGDAARTRKKIRKFMIHAANSVRIAIDARNFDVSLLHCLHRIPQCQSNRLLILLERAEKEI